MLRHKYNILFTQQFYLLTDKVIEADEDKPCSSVTVAVIVRLPGLTNHKKLNKKGESRFVRPVS